MIVVDSSVWIARFRGVANTAADKFEEIEEAEADEILVGDLVMLELLQGARSDAHAAFIEQRLREFRVEAMLDAGLAAIAARNFRFLRGRGVTLRKTADLIIATFCIERGHALLHDDRDFDAVARHLPLAII
ncbi:MAG: PIN domain-containing protein [Roseiarcus sp.]